MNMPEPPIALSTPDVKNAELVAAALAIARDDPDLALTIEALRAECCAKLAEAVDKLVPMLAPPRAANEPVPIGKPLNPALLTARSRQGLLAVTGGRELAEALVIGALINQGNPEWDPARPETSRAPGQGALYALMSSASDNG